MHHQTDRLGASSLEQRAEASVGRGVIVRGTHLTNYIITAAHCLPEDYQRNQLPSPCKKKSPGAEPLAAPHRVVRLPSEIVDAGETMITAVTVASVTA